MKTRILEQRHHYYKIIVNGKTYLARVLGKFMNKANAESEYPVVGDIVDVDIVGDKNAVINFVEKRTSKISRKSAKGIEQVLAANIDYALICASMNDEFNINRIDRYIAISEAGGVTPIILLTKADLANEGEIASRIKMLNERSSSLQVFSLSTKIESDKTKSELINLLTNKGAVVLGSSGVGKSSLINFLINQNKLKISEVRESDSKGRHTTSHRELVSLDNGGFIIDTPGLREIQFDDDVKNVETQFDDILEIGLMCKFSNCTHLNEPQCAVLDALKSGNLDNAKYSNYAKMKREELEIEKNKWKKK